MEWVLPVPSLVLSLSVRRRNPKEDVMNDQLSHDRPNVTRGVIHWGIRETMGLIMYIPFLFWPAGTWNWPMAWALIAITAMWIIGTALVTIPRCPELLAERVGPRKGGKAWDTAILGVIGILMLVKMLLSGFDFHYGWTIALPVWAEIAGMVAAMVGYGLVVWATGSNAYFSQIVRIQSERGHTVATGGPYRFVRHPAYIGMIFIELGTSVMLGSWLALIPGGISAVLLILRTMLEDRVLLTELAGYKEFAEKIHYRLVPGVW
jgi:protein-S-isoprenylcysteine O-methyltransferase Ste14